MYISEIVSLPKSRFLNNRPFGVRFVMSSRMEIRHCIRQVEYLLAYYPMYSLMVRMHHGDI